MPFNQLPFNSSEKTERPKEKLDRLMGDLANKVNSQVGEEILNSDARVNLDKWRGVYGDETIDTNLEMIRSKELEGSSARNDGTQRFYKTQHPEWKEEGQALIDKIVKTHLEKRESSNPFLLEKFATVVFHKVLGDKFVVMRSSKHDDYENGFDNIIVNKETGDVICAFDEVHSEAKHGGVDRKEEKIRSKARNGGANIKYGLTFEDDENGHKKMVKKKIANVPTFFLSMEPQDLQEALRNMNGNLDDAPSAVELKVFDQFIISLEGQIEILKKDHLPSGVANNIESFKKSLVGIKELRVRF